MRLLIASVLLGCAAAAAAFVAGRDADRRRASRRAREQVGLRTSRPAHLGIRWLEAIPGMDARTLRTAAWVSGCAAVGVVLFGPGGLLAGGIPLLAGRLSRQRAERVRARNLATELAPSLQLLVDNLRVGRDLVSALAEVAGTVGEPIGSMFASVVAEVRLGSPVGAAFAVVADAEGDRHLRAVSSAVSLHSEHGGNLVEILSTVIETIEEEDRLRRDLAALTADGRLSSQVLLGMPVVALLAVSVLSPGYATPLFATAMGRVLSVMAVTMAGVGWLWLRALSRPGVLG